MSVKINKKSLKEYGGAVPPNYGPTGFFQQGGSMIPAQPAMMDEAAAVQQQQQAMAQQMDQPVEVKDEGRQMAEQLLQAIQAAVQEGSDIVEVIKVVIEQSGNEEVVKAALMMGGMEEQAVLEIIDKAKEPAEPSTPQEVDANPQLLARNEELAKEEEKMPEQQGASPEQIMMGKSGIEIKPENKGKFTAWAKKRGMTVKEAYRKVLANKSRYPASVVKMANFARNAAGWKKEEGGEYINGVYIPDESELSENALKNNLQRPASFYMADQNYSVAPYAPPSTVNPLFDFLNTAATVNQELFSQELDEFGNRKGAFLDIGKSEYEAFPEFVENEIKKLDDDDVAIMVYTSGTTGPPKGSMITHGNLRWVATQLPYFPISNNLSEGDSQFLSYLPLCHVFGRLIDLLIGIHLMATINFAESIDTVQADLAEIQPTIFPAVPRILEKMHTGAIVRMKDASFLKRILFKFSMYIGAVSYTHLTLPTNREV